MRLSTFDTKPSLHKDNSNLYEADTTKGMVTWSSIPAIEHDVYIAQRKESTLTNMEGWPGVNFDLPRWCLINGEACDSQFYPRAPGTPD